MTEAILQLDAISDLEKVFPGHITRHPLVAVVDFSRMQDNCLPGTRIRAGFYSVMFKDHCPNSIRYGRTQLDFQKGNLICIAPGQVIVMDESQATKERPEGWGLFFHPDLLRGTRLAEEVRAYTFFSYSVSEALHLSAREQDVLKECLRPLVTELEDNIDAYTQRLIASMIDQLLNHCARCYDRQFISRKAHNEIRVEAFEIALKACFQEATDGIQGIPSVRRLAEKLFLTPDYLSDLLKRETGLTAQDHIHHYLIEEAKNKLLGSNATVGELAYALGFEYPQYFSRLFKSKTGMTPSAYRHAFLNN